jgi:predicted TPR repeat methyltransferase
MGERKGGFLDKAYDVADSEATKNLYDDWAATYEQEIKANGYATPERCAKALAAQVADRTAPLLDLGCGTGLSGEAFRAAGFTTIDGTDFSREMLERARGKANLYRKLMLGDLNNPIPAKAGEYAQAAAVGVFSPSHAPAEMIETVLDLLPPGGCFVFSLNDHALAEPSYRQTIDRLAREGKAELVFDEYGDHLPKTGIKSSVCVLRKT